MIPLQLERRMQETTHDGKKAKHYILHINMDFRLADLQKFALIEPTKMMLELPAPEEDKTDLLFRENVSINPESIVPCEYPEFVEQAPLALPVKKLLRQYDKGGAGLCPSNDAFKPKDDCNGCKLYDGCPAYQ